MAEESSKTSGDANDTDELLHNDMDDNRSVFDASAPPLRHDPCDLLLDSIDSQLNRLQVQHQKHKEGSGGHSGCDEAPFSRGRSVSRDTGLGTQTTSTPVPCLDLGHPEAKGRAPGKMRPAVSQEAPPWPLQAPPGPLQRATQPEVAGRMVGEEQEEAESRREQCLWRLGLLLGEACGAAGGGPTPPAPPPQLDSVCTEDFLGRFREEMVGFPGAASCLQWPEREAEGHRGSVEEGWWTGGSSQRAREQRDAVEVTRGGLAVMPVESGRGACVLHHPPVPQPQQAQTHGLSQRTCFEESDSRDGHEVRVRPRSVETKAGQRNRGTQKTCDHFSIQSGLPAPDTLASAQPCTMQQDQNEKPSSKLRGSAGVSLWSLDTASIDSDRDSICTQHVTQCSRNRTAREKGRLGGSSFGRARQTKRDTARYGQSVDNDDGDYGNNDNEDTDEGHGSRRRKNWCLNKTPEFQLEKMKSDWSRMEELLSTLHHKCETEEGKLKQRRRALREAESSLSDAQQKKKELAQICAESAQMEMERRRLEASLREGKASLQLCGLERESCLQPIRGLKKESGTQCLMTQDGCRAETNQTGVVVSVLERLEIERQLDSAKTQLFAEQRRSRDKLDSMQELLDEASEDLQRAREEEGLLRSRCDALEEKQRQKQELVEALERESGELREQLAECTLRLGSLESIVAQKDVQLTGVQEEQSSLCAARDGLQGELQTLKQQHRKAMSQVQEQVCKMAAEEKDNALREQAKSFTRQLESVQISLKLREDEARRLRQSLEKQKEAVKKQEVQMHAEATEKVRKAVEVERNTWEKDNMAALQQLEDRNQETLEEARSDLEEERKNAMALQKHVAELKTKVAELEGVCCFQKRKQDSALAKLHSSLTEEHRAELKRQRRHMEQEFARRLWRLEETGQLAEREADRLRQVMGEREGSHQRITASQEQQLRQVTQGVVAECHQLCLLLDQRGSRGKSMQLHQSPTAAEATQYLQDLRMRLQNMIDHLDQELESQKQNTSKLKHAMEQELCTQREKLEIEKQQALHSLKERLIQEHVEELSSARRGSGVCRSCRQPGGGAEASLRRQLQAKDQEARRVQSSMDQWKSRTAARLAARFEEELTAELERCREKLLKSRRISKTQEEKPRRFDGAKELCDFRGQQLVSDPHRTPGPSDTASLKLLQHLQSRLRQLRAENQSSPSITPLRQQPVSDLSGSYLETVHLS